MKIKTIEQLKQLCEDGNVVECHIQLGWLGRSHKAIQHWPSGFHAYQEDFDNDFDNLPKDGWNLVKWGVTSMIDDSCLAYEDDAALAAGTHIITAMKKGALILDDS